MQTPQPAKSSPFSAYLADPLRYWEARRLMYNTALVAVCFSWVAATWPHFRPALHWAFLLPLAGLGLMANLCYSAAYLVDIPLQHSPLRTIWLRARWALWLGGTLLGIVLANYWISDEISPLVR
jgi:hypothetical protein